MSTEPSTKR